VFSTIIKEGINIKEEKVMNKNCKKMHWMIGVLLAVLFAFGFVGCGASKQTQSSQSGDSPSSTATAQSTTAQSAGAQPANSKKLSVVTTIFPEYDWVRQIIGDTNSADITMLLDNGVDLHSYQPTAEDIMKISNCDLFIYVGGESDAWVKKALSEATNKNMKVINLMEIMGDSAKEEEVVEGMQPEKEEEGKKEEEEPEQDEHVWLSLKNAQKFCKVIADDLAELDPANAQKYQENVTSYCNQLASLDTEYANTVKSGKKNTILFADRFPFRYLVDDYGLKYYAAFVGCSAETEVSFDTIAFLAKKVNELGLSSILQIESGNGRIADTVKKTTSAKNQKTLTMDSMQSTTTKDVNDGATYLSIMKKNLEVLKEALN
jgi:putative adhesion lipoprotein